MQSSSKKLTGYPSIDKPWLKYYKSNAEESANIIPENKTVWDVIEERLYKYIDIPAIEYFGRVISRKEFINNVYLWAKVFKRLGVKVNEVIAYYGPFMPDVCYMTLALNVIGACPYFLKLSITPEALAEETKECRFAIVFEQMWSDVQNEFIKDRFETVIIARITDAMAAPKKQTVWVLSRINSRTKIPKGKKYITVKEAKKLANEYDGETKTSYVSGRPAFITSSSGTTVGGVIKGIIATNETVISLILSEIASEIPVNVGDRALNHFPPTAATSILSLFLMPLFCGGTIVMDPRVSEFDFYNQIVKLKPNVVVTTGSSWEKFFNRIKNEKKEGLNYIFNYASYWIVGGEGADIKKIREWDEIVCSAHGDALYSGYGQSELFSTICVENQKARYNFTKPVMSVGIPLAGMIVGVFDNDGNELKYNKRGELRIKSESAMKEYYNKPELTAQTKVHGWIHTGDLAEIDENGFVYIWGRMTDKIKLVDGREIYFFDIANKIKEKEYIDDAMVLEKPIGNNKVNLFAHIVWDKGVKDINKEKYLKELTSFINQYEPDINLCIYAFHDEMLPYSPTTLKKDKNKMSKQMKDYVMVTDNGIEKIFFSDIGNGVYKINRQCK